MRLLPLITFIFVLFTSSSFAKEITLYKDFNYNMSKQDIAKIKPIEECEDVGANMLCATDLETFYGIEFLQAFSMDKNKLKKVMLFGELEVNSYTNLFVKLGQSHIILFGESLEGDIFNGFNYLNDLEKYSKVLVEWELSTNESEQLTYYLVDIESAAFMIKNKISDLATYYASAPKDLRMIEVIVQQYEEVFAITFNAPVALIKEAQEMPDEKF